ncbi:MAG: DUF2089 domain-containing protein [Chloroflexota bacterium]|nr:DUF2089 domain-containing protein [Chloroflexota bacterium]
MNTMPGKCPVCSAILTVTHLQCGQCGTGISGAFGAGRLQSLSADQLQFVETFIKCRGKIKDVEGELGISYPTVVGRLNEVVRAMGFEVGEGDLSEVDQFEFYQAQALHPQVGIPRTPMAPPALPPVPSPQPGPRLSPDRRQQILDDLASGKLTAAEAMAKLQG